MKIGAFGEVMLRLTPPEYLLLEQTNTLRMEFTGTGVNLLANLSHFGHEVTLISTLPETRLGEAAVAHIRKLGIGTRFLRHENDHMGSFLAEMGYGLRPTQVTYQNRRNSAFSLAESTTYDFERFVAENDLVHICGISLSLSEKTAVAAQILAEKVKAAGKILCFDFNFRPALNQQKEQRALLKKRYEDLLPYCDLVFGSVRDLVELLEFGEAPKYPEEESKLIQAFMLKYQIQWFAGTKRQKRDLQPVISGQLHTREAVVDSKQQVLKVLDRIGAGDAYAAGILLAFAEGWDLQKAVDFAVANSVLAHTIEGDVPLTTRKMVQHYLEQPDVDLLR